MASSSSQRLTRDEANANPVGSTAVLHWHLSVAVPAAEELSGLYRSLVCSYIFDLSNNQLPHLCCQMDSKAPNTHLVCALNGRLGEGSWKAVEEKRSVLDPSGVAQGRGAASRAGSWLAGRASTEQRKGVRDSIPMRFLMLLFTQLCDTCILSLVQQGVRPLCLLSGLCIPQHSSSAQLGTAGGVPAFSTAALQLLA